MNNNELPRAEVSEQEQDKESIVARALKKFRRVALVGYLGTTSVLGGYMVTGALENRAKYEAHLTESSAQDRERYAELRKQLVEQVGEKTVENMEEADRIAFWERSRGEPAENPTISGFEVAGIPSNELNTLWSENGSYPEGWLKGNVKSIQFNSDLIKMGKEYGDALEGKRAGGATAEHMRTITISPDAVGSKDVPADERLESLDFIVGHEGAHLNDWDSKVQLELAARVKLFAQVLARIGSEDHYQEPGTETTGSYHERIKSDDVQATRALQASEYWGDICTAYLNIPNYLRTKHPKDYELVDSFVKSGDPSFDPDRAVGQREELIQSIATHMSQGGNQP
ncbi:MAG: hypothetical protein RL681_439 [Candidatus Parcubacteria bacterium]|jgi:hypothetical protein